MSAGVLVVGASLAGVRAVEALRRNGYGGPVTLIGDEEELPYDRPPLSKAILTSDAGIDTLQLGTSGWLSDNDLEVCLGERAERLDLARRSVITASRTFEFDDLIVATGARCRSIFDDRVAGSFTLRTYSDALALRKALQSTKHLVVIGAGFIGLEVASSARDLGIEATVIEAAPAPLSRSLGGEVAQIVASLATAAGVDVRAGTGVQRLIVDAGAVRGVELSDGTQLSCETVVVGVGAIPNTEWLVGNALTITNAGLICDSTGRAAPHVWAAGDVCTWTDVDGVPHRHEHWTSAGDQAVVVAANLVDGGHRRVPSASYAWSDQFGVRINLIGDTAAEADIRFVNRGPRDLAALYGLDGRLVGAVIIGKPKMVALSRRWVAANTPLQDLDLWTNANP